MGIRAGISIRPDGTIDEAMRDKAYAQADANGQRKYSRKTYLGLPDKKTIHGSKGNSAGTASQGGANT